jgi:hypothetical protein
VRLSGSTTLVYIGLKLVKTFELCREIIKELGPSMHQGSSPTSPHALS